jgi:redox-sensitive bicupin YhaK (pirin superfamily)
MSSAETLTQRGIVHRTRGHRQGPITRLMSPSDLGEVVKPFVFLDLFEAGMGEMDMPVHPHSGIATVTVFTKGDVRFDDPQAGKGRIAYGGVEWLRAGGGVWHGKELSAGSSLRAQGFQLWVALPPELENGPAESQYIEASEMKRAGHAHVIVGAYQGVESPVRAPAGFNYLLVTLKAGETWTYQPPAGHSVAWLAIAEGTLDAGERLSAGDMAVFDRSEAPIRLTALGTSETVFVLGSAVPHPHDLHLGYYSVHTSAEALARGESRIEELGRKLAGAGDRRTQSGSTPVFR